MKRIIRSLAMLCPIGQLSEISRQLSATYRHYRRKRPNQRLNQITSSLLIAVLTIMCLQARAQRPDSSGPVLSGIIADTSGHPLSGTTVAIKGTSTKTISGRDGRFSLRAPQQSGILTISHLGHEIINEKFGDGNTGPYHFTLIPSENMLEEVEVNTGYQTIPKERATGSFELVDNKLFNRKVSTDIISRLDGVVAGLWVQKSVGAVSTSDIPFASIRGTSTMGPQKWPLIISPFLRTLFARFGPVRLRLSYLCLSAALPFPG